MIKAIVIEDEPHCSKRLLRLLEETQDIVPIRIAGVFDSFNSGLQAIGSEKPDLVFMDVKLGEKTAFELLQQLDNMDFRLIFTTAYEQYAIQAFRFSALDYLLKPILKDDLKNALQKINSKKEEQLLQQQLKILLHNFSEAKYTSKKICVPMSNGWEVVSISDIIRCESEINYTNIFLKTNEKFLVSKTLKEFELMLKEYDFCRVHQSHLINLAYVKRYLKGKGGIAVMTDNSHIEVATRKKDEFLKRLSNL